ncbi:gamma-aminobutyric acid receptor subunit beta-1 [Platysternon megacephalum]|uniref:Gamma-aminobutyric acid receptor subunit beta-1 n=1 Tax=Platysternon megacephalum TaxID=55544 RepID=A0A4D9FBD3_9SAUR|nr:gamma-aminobutyric acid receptor subunit beta-1 [Platysternon megacephalum]
MHRGRQQQESSTSILTPMRKGLCVGKPMHQDKGRNISILTPVQRILHRKLMHQGTSRSTSILTPNARDSTQEVDAPWQEEKHKYSPQCKGLYTGSSCTKAAATQASSPYCKGFCLGNRYIRATGKTQESSPQCMGLCTGS